MSRDQISVEPAAATSEPFPIAELVRVSLARKKAIAGTTLVAAALSVAVSFAIPPTYLATTTLLPPQQAQGGAAALLSQLGGAAGLVASAAGMKNPGELYVGILKSRTVTDDLVKRMGLLAVYETDSLEKAREALKGSTTISSGKDGFISITVEDHDKVRAAQLANAYVDSLTKLTKVLAVTEAAQRRLFFERQLEASKNNLAGAEIALKRGLDAKGVISVDADSRTALETSARLRARISAKEVELNAMRSFVTENNNEFKRAQAELASMRAELATLENGRPSAVLEPSGDGTKSGLENIKLLRDVKYQQMLYELLAKQYEAARLEEARDSSVIQVLDPAVAPERKTKPRRAIIVLASTLFAFVVSVAACYWIERRKRVLDMDQRGGVWPAAR